MSWTRTCIAVVFGGTMGCMAMAPDEDVGAADPVPAEVSAEVAVACQDFVREAKASPAREQGFRELLRVTPEGHPEHAHVELELSRQVLALGRTDDACDGLVRVHGASDDKVGRCAEAGLRECCPGRLPPRLEGAPTSETCSPEDIIHAHDRDGRSD